VPRLTAKLKSNMIIKHFFEPKDFYAMGQTITRKSEKLSITLVYKIGYKYGDVDKPAQAVLIAMSDGLCEVFDNTETLCDRLNKDELGFRPITTEELVHLMKEQGNRFPQQKQNKTK
jgi:hypothetical protein